MSSDSPIFAQIQALLDASQSAGLAELEDTLTSGYAAALALEAERWRIERRISEMAGDLGDGSGEKTQEIAVLASRLGSADSDLSRLRALLASLRDRAEAARAA